MDSETQGALTAATIDPGKAEQWFDIVTQAHTQSGNDWAAFSDKLTADAGSEFSAAAEQFLRYTEDHGKTDTIAKLVADPRALPTAYTQAHAAAGGSAGEQTTDAWQQVITQFGPGWAGWDGSETGWAQFRDWLYSAANTQDPALYTAAYEHIDPLNTAPIAQRISTLTQYGFTITATPGATAAAPAATTDPWATIVEQFGAGWAGWDGSEAGWAQFRDWLYSATNSQNPDLYTLAYQRLNPLNDQGPAERIASLKDLGLTINATAPTTAPAAEAPVSLDTILDDALTNALDAIPGADTLTDAELASIRADVAAQLAQ